MEDIETEFEQQQTFVNSGQIKILLAKYGTQISTDKILNSVEFLNNQNYYLQGFISAGSFGAVLLAINSLTKEKVAIKLLIAQDKETRSQWIQEGQKVKSIVSPNVIQIITWFEDEKNECIYLVMEYCENGNLAQYVKEKELSSSQIIKLFISILKGLEDIHRKPIIHSDIKPTNIVLGKDYEPKICDLGLSKLLQKGQTHVSSSSGTLSYQPMEQISKRLVLESDYYAAGCLLCFMCGVPIEEDVNLMLELKQGQSPPIESGKFKRIIQVAYSMMKYNPKERTTPAVAQKLLQSILDNDLVVNENLFSDYEYVGQYVQGQKSGSGIEFYLDGKKKYEGQWLNDKKEGQGIYFYQNGDTLTVSHKIGLKQGNGEEKYSNGKIKFKGTWLDDFKHGKGLTYLENGNIIEATYEKGQKTGYGKETLNNGDILVEGQFLNDKKNGQGKVYENKVLKFEGEFLNDKIHYGTLYYSNGESYLGTFKNDLRDGKGTLLTKEKNKKYVGEYSADIQNGKGVFYDENGEIFSGTFLKGLLDGKCLHYKKGIDIPDQRNYKNGIPESGYFKQIDKEGHLVFEGQMKNFYYEEGDYYYNGKLRFKGVFDSDVSSVRLTKGISYVDGIKKYQGSFVNGFHDGKGQLFEQSCLIYEGTFKKSFYEGDGKLYKSGELTYEGQFKAGSYQGNGKLYENGQLIYQGEFSNGLYQGKGKLYKLNSLIYEGEFQKSAYTGYGKLYTNCQLIYEGEFKNNVYEGKGKLYENNPLNNTQYSQQNQKQRVLSPIKNNSIAQQQLSQKNNSLLYEGEFKNGNFEGIGTLYKNNKLIYNGQFKAGVYEGAGKLYENNNLIYEGQFLKNYYEGQGKLYNSSGLIYDGQFIKSTYEGNGKLYQDNQLIYQGQFKNNLYEGKGKLYNNNNLIYDGEFLKGKYSGNGKNQLPNGDVWEGSFKDNSMVSGTIKLSKGGNLELKDGKFKGTMKYPDVEETYEGELDNAFKRNGSGIFYKGKFKTFEGEYKNDSMFNGQCYKPNSKQKSFTYVNGEKIQQSSACNIF